MRKVDMGGITISPLQKKLVNKCLDNNRLSYGDMTRKFELEWAKMHQVKYAMFCNSGTSALQVAIHALKEEYNWQDGDEILLPAVTFVASMNVILQNNLKPVFVDIEPDYFSIDPDNIISAITEKTKAIMVVHLLGHPALMDEIMKIAKKYKLKIIEDSCETVVSTFDSKPVGSFGDVSCFSTYASHLVVTGVGGFACTNNPKLAVRIKGLYNHGRDGIYHSIDDDDKNSIKIINNRFNFTHSGYSYRATEMESALGIGHLQRFSKELKKRQFNAAYLTNKLKKLEGGGYLSLPKIHPKATHSFMLYAIVLAEEINRKSVLEYLEKNGVMTRFLMPLLNQPIVEKLFGKIEDKYPVAKYIDENGFLLGIHSELEKSDFDYVSKVLNEAIDKYAKQTFK
jgi:perosamine synthetase